MRAEGEKREALALSRRGEGLEVRETETLQGEVRRVFCSDRPPSHPSPRAQAALSVRPGPVRDTL